MTTKQEKREKIGSVQTAPSRRWVLLDAKGEILGRFASRVAQLLMGKYQLHYMPHVDRGDAVVVINAQFLRVTGKKAEQKVYPRHTGYPRGYREVSYEELMASRPAEVLQHAVDGMLPKNKLKADRMRRLHVYGGETHPHVAQQPVPLATKE